MIDINRINELARKSKTVGLTDEEKAEQAKLRRAYIDSVVSNLKSQLDNTYIVDDSGEVKLTASSNSDDDDANGSICDTVGCANIVGDESKK